MKENMKMFWGLFFILALLVPYILGVWDDYGYAWVVGAAIVLMLIILLGRHVAPTFWWEGLRRKNKKEAHGTKENSTATKRQS